MDAKLILHDRVVTYVTVALACLLLYSKHQVYDVLAARGFSHETEKVAVDEWIVQFTRS